MLLFCWKFDDSVELKDFGEEVKQPVHPNIINLGVTHETYEFEECERDDVVNFIVDNATKLRELSLRMVLKVADLKKAFPANWQAMAKTTCMRRV